MNLGGRADRIGILTSSVGGVVPDTDGISGITIAAVHLSCTPAGRNVKTATDPAPRGCSSGGDGESNAYSKRLGLTCRATRR